MEQPGLMLDQKQQSNNQVHHINIQIILVQIAQAAQHRSKKEVVKTTSILIGHEWPGAYWYNHITSRRAGGYCGGECFKQLPLINYTRHSNDTCSAAGAVDGITTNDADGLPKVWNWRH